MGRFTQRPWMVKEHKIPMPSGASVPVSIALTPQTQIPRVPLIALACMKEIHVIHLAHFLNVRSLEPADGLQGIPKAPPNSKGEFTGTPSGSSDNAPIAEPSTVPVPPRIPVLHHYPWLFTTLIPEGTITAPTHPIRFGLNGAQQIVYSTNFLGNNLNQKYLAASPDNWFAVLNKSTGPDGFQKFPGGIIPHPTAEPAGYIHPMYLFADYYIVICPKENDVRIITLSGGEYEIKKAVVNPRTVYILFALPPPPKTDLSAGIVDGAEPVCRYSVHVSHVPLAHSHHC